MADSNRCHGQGHVSENREYIKFDIKESAFAISARSRIFEST